MSDIEQFIIVYITSNSDDPDAAIDSSTNFVTSRMLDSFAILNLVMTLESEFAIKFEPQELADTRTHVVGQLAQMVASKAG